MEITNKTFNGEWALILGGSSGMGWAAAQKLSAEGMNVCIVHRDRRRQEEEFLERVEEIRQRGGRVETFNLNALAPESREKVLSAVAGWGKIKVLVHSIAWGNLKLLAPPRKKQADSPIAALYEVAAPVSGQYLSSEDYRLTIEAMATSLWDWASAILERDLWEPDARIIGLTSEGARKAWPYYAAVSAAKATLEALGRSMALELAPYGIRTNIIQSGITDTPALKLIPGSEAMKKIALAKNPFGRITVPEDVANVIYLLARPEAAWINGTIITVDGGETLL